MGSWPELVAVASPLLHLSMYATSPRLVPVPVVTSARILSHNNGIACESPEYTHSRDDEPLRLLTRPHLLLRLCYSRCHLP